MIPKKIILARHSTYIAFYFSDDPETVFKKTPPKFKRFVKKGHKKRKVWW